MAYKNMKILVRLNQAEALRKGIDSPNSTATIDVQPQDLTEIHRNTLAAILLNGNDATELGLRTDKAEIVAQPTIMQGKKVTLLPFTQHTDPLSLIEPSIHGLRAGLDRIVAQQKEGYRAHSALLQEKSKLMTTLLTCGGEKGYWDYVFCRDHKTGEVKHQGYGGKYPLAPHTITARLPVKHIPYLIGDDMAPDLTKNVQHLEQELKIMADAEADRLLPKVRLQVQAMESLETVKPQDSFRIIARALMEEPTCQGVLFVLPGGQVRHMTANVLESRDCIDVEVGTDWSDGGFTIHYSVLMVFYSGRWMFLNWIGDSLPVQVVKHQSLSLGSDSATYEVTVEIPEDADQIVVNGDKIWQKP